MYLDFAGSNFLKVLSGGAVLLLTSSFPVSVFSVCSAAAAAGAVVGCSNGRRWNSLVKD